MCFFSTFLERVQSLDKKNIFSNQGGHTFFIPVDEVANVSIFWINRIVLVLYYFWCLVFEK